MIPLDDHIAELSLVIRASDYWGEWMRIYEWLHIAGSIESVSLDTIKNTQSFGWCRDSDEYDIAKDELMQNFVCELSVFNFIWGALESTIDLIKPKKRPNNKHKEKIGDTCYLLGKNYSIHSCIKYLRDESELFNIKSKECFGFEKIQERITKIDDFGIAGVGLYAVYELRNLFAHGSMSFPEPDGNNEPNSPYNSLVNHASRIVLITIQMLLLHHYECEGHEIFNLSLSEDTTLDIALRTCHLKGNEIDGQLPLI